MTKAVFCRKYRREMPGLEAPPFPGPAGQDIHDNISLQAWQDWQRHQTMLINEKHLNLRDMNDRRFLMEQMKKFFSGDDYEKPAGYVPPEE